MIVAPKFEYFRKQPQKNNEEPSSSEDDLSLGDIPERDEAYDSVKSLDSRNLYLYVSSLASKASKADALKMLAQYIAEFTNLITASSSDNSRDNSRDNIDYYYGQALCEFEYLKIKLTTTSYYLKQKKYSPLLNKINNILDVDPYHSLADRLLNEIQVLLSQDDRIIILNAHGTLAHKGFSKAPQSYLVDLIWPTLKRDRKHFNQSRDFIKNVRELDKLLDSGQAKADDYLQHAKAMADLFTVTSSSYLIKQRYAIIAALRVRTHVLSLFAIRVFLVVRQCFFSLKPQLI
jgi:hypothetical protein